MNAYTAPNPNIAMSFMARVSLLPNYRMMAMSQRYREMIFLVERALSDPLLARDYGIAELKAIKRYFEKKRDEFASLGM